MEEVFFKLYSDLHNAAYKDSNPLKKFLFTTKQHAILIFFITSQKNMQCTLEEICYNVSSKVISRSTIQNILKEGTSLGFFQKELNIKDKRSKFFRITKEAKNLLQTWASEQSDTFEKLKKIA